MDGLDALKLTRLVRPDLLVLALRMAIVTVLEALALVRAACPSTRTILYTSDGSLIDSDAAQTLGAAAVADKRIRPSHLLRLIRRVALRQASGPLGRAEVHCGAKSKKIGPAAPANGYGE